MAKLIMEYDPDLSVNDGRYPPLICAIEREGYELAEMLLAQGADPNTLGKISETALGMAVKKGQLQLVRLLLEKGANPNLPAELNSSNVNKRPLAVAISKRDVEAIRLLASHGATATFPGRGANVLAEVIRNADPEFLQALIDVSAESILPDGRQQLLYYAILVGNADLVQSLIKTGVDLNAPLNGNLAPLAAAIRARSAEMIRLLATHGAKVNFSDVEQELLKAVRDRNPAFLNALVDTNVDAILPDGIQHLLYAAVLAKNTVLVQSLIDAGADVEALLADSKSAEAVLRAGPGPRCFSGAGGRESSPSACDCVAAIPRRRRRDDLADSLSVERERT